MNKLSGLRTHILGLDANTSYEVFYIEASDIGPSAGKIWTNNIVHTMANDNCRIIYDVPNCPFIAQTVPAPRLLLSYYPSYDRNITEDTAMLDISNMTALSTMYGNLVKSQVTSFNQFLALNDQTSLFYSQMRDCSDCRVVYAAWLCSIMAPRCIDSFERDLKEPEFENIDKAIPGLYNVYRQVMLNSIARYIGSAAGSDFGEDSENGSDLIATLSQRLPRLRARDVSSSGNDSDSGQCPLSRPDEPEELGLSYKDLPDDAAGNVTQKRTYRKMPHTSRPRQLLGRRKRQRAPRQHRPNLSKRTIEWDVASYTNYELDDTTHIFPCRGASCLFPESNDTYLELMPCIDSCHEC
ncbi:stretch-activated cation channel mid1, partial [Linderina macrospora]